MADVPNPPAFTATPFAEILSSNKVRLHAPLHLYGVASTLTFLLYTPTFPSNAIQATQSVPAGTSRAADYTVTFDYLSGKLQPGQSCEFYVIARNLDRSVSSTLVAFTMPAGKTLGERPGSLGLIPTGVARGTTGAWVPIPVYDAGRYQHMIGDGDPSISALGLQFTPLVECWLETNLRSLIRTTTASRGSYVEAQTTCSPADADGISTQQHARLHERELHTGDLAGFAIWHLLPNVAYSFYTRIYSLIPVGTATFEYWDGPEYTTLHGRVLTVI
jgi:hypothetical protein